MWIRWIVWITILLIGLMGLTSFYGRYQWRVGTDRLRTQLTNGQQSIQPQTYDSKELEGLPVPVQRFFRAVLKDGQPIVTAVNISQQGQMNMSETEVKWNPFIATQLVIAQRPGFDWDAQVQIIPGIVALVHDTYLLGKGSLHAAILGLFSVADIQNTHEANQGELLRFFAETAWYPTSLLPSQGVRWEVIDDISAIGTLIDGETTVSLIFRFSSEGPIETVYTKSRYRGLVATPWEGRFWNYTVQNGMQIPLEGEVSWYTSKGIWPYWRCQVKRISYEFGSSANLTLPS